MTGLRPPADLVAANKCELPWGEEVVGHLLEEIGGIRPDEFLNALDDAHMRRIIHPLVGCYNVLNL